MRILIGNTSGSGFLVSDEKNVYLVTAKHVLYQYDAVSKIHSPISSEFTALIYPFFSGKVQTTARKYQFDLTVLEKAGHVVKHDLVDLTVVKLGPKDSVGTIIFVPGVREAQSSEGAVVNYNLVNARSLEEVEITNTVFVLGYPASLSTKEMDQIDYDQPLARRGVVAGKNYKNGTIILDCPVYGGNSGGLVLELNDNNLHLIGIVTQFVPYVEQWQNTRMPALYNTNLQNSGYSIAIPVDYILESIAQVEYRK